MPSHVIFSMVQGYHVYKDIWNTEERETLRCMRETTTIAVFVVKEGVGTVGHVPKKISALCSLFLRRGGGILCTVDGGRRRSHDLPQGGLEIPCTLTFTSEQQSSIDKIRYLFKGVDNVVVICSLKGSDKSEIKEQKETKDANLKDSLPPPPKVMKLDEGDDHDTESDSDSAIWVFFDSSTVLSRRERNIIFRMMKLNDVIIKG